MTENTKVNQNKAPLDFLSRLLIQLPQRGEFLNRLSDLPLKERAHALTALLTLAEKNITLNQKDWHRLWSLIKKNTLSIPHNEAEARTLFSPLDQDKNGLGEESLMAEHQKLTYSLLPIEEREKRGQIAIGRENGSDNLFIRMETAARHWEFHLVQPRQKATPRLVAFTNDQELIKEPPPEWDKFRKKMSQKSIFVERRIKFLRKPLFLSENDKRELDHLVDIVL